MPKRASSISTPTSVRKNPRHQVLVLNAGTPGPRGNTSIILERAVRYLRAHARVTSIELQDHDSFARVAAHLRRADALIIGTGTYWDSWSHRLQKLLEDATPTEATELWLGKPVGIVVTMHSVGGKGVLTRLQGVLNTFGCSLPPMSGVVLSEVNQAASENPGDFAPDLWSEDDVEIVCHNVLQALLPKPAYRAWPHDSGEARRRWIRAGATGDTSPVPHIRPKRSRRSS